MSDEHTQAIKNLLATAAGPSGVGDDGWHAAGVDRLYFQHPHDLKMAGFVEVRRSEDNTGYVRLELHVPPEVAAEMIGRITGATAPDRLITWAHKFSADEQAQAEAIVTAAETEALALIQASVGRGNSSGLELSKSTADMSNKDAARMEELTQLIAEQGADVDEDEDDLDEPVELDFERSA